VFNLHYHNNAVVQFLSVHPVVSPLCEIVKSGVVVVNIKISHCFTDSNLDSQFCIVCQQLLSIGRRDINLLIAVAVLNSVRRLDR